MTAAQILGVVLIAVGATLLWSPWALVVAGVLLITVPELRVAWSARQVRKRFEQEAKGHRMAQTP